MSNPAQLQQSIERALEGGASLEDARALMHTQEQVDLVNQVYGANTNTVKPAQPPQNAREELPKNVKQELLTAGKQPHWRDQMDGFGEREEVDVLLPSGETITVDVPAGKPDEAIIRDLMKAGEWDLPEDQITGENNKARAILNGAFVGAGPQVTAGVAAAGAKLATMLPGEQAGEDSSFGQVYRDIVQWEQEQLASYRQQAPWASAGHELLGGVGTAALTRKMPVLGFSGKTMPEQMAVGAGWAGAYGFNETIPDPDSTFTENILQRTKGGLEYAPYGAAGAPLLKGAGAAYQGAKRQVQKVKIHKASNDYAARQKLGETIDHNILVRIAAGEDKSKVYGDVLRDLGIDNTSDLPLKIAMERRASFQRLLEKTPEQAADDLAINGLMKHGILQKGAMKGMDEIIQPLYDRIERYSPRVAQMLRGYEGKVYQLVHNWHESAEPFLQHVQGLSKNHKYLFGKFVYNGKFNEARELLVNSRGGDAGQQFDDILGPKGLLQQITKELEATGAKFGNKFNFFPRRTKDIEGLKKQLGSDYLIGFERYEKLLKGKGSGREARALENYMNGYRKHSKKETSMYTRKIKEIDDDLMPFYHDPVASFDLFLRESAQQLERRRLFGKVHLKENKDGVELIDDTIDSFVGHFDKLPAEAKNEIAELLKIRFNQGELGMTPFVSKLRAIAHNSLLGDLVSATTQLADIGVSAWVFGFRPTLKALLSKRDITADELGILREMVSEVSDPGSIHRVTDQIFRLSFFRAADRLGKNVAINAAWNKYTRMVKSNKGKKKVIEELSPYWGDETPQLIDDLEKGIINDRTKVFLFSKLSDMQPISRTEMPQKFLEMQNGRIAYQLMTWTMKQFNLVRKEALRKILKGNAKERAEGIALLGSALIYIGGSNLTTDEAKRWLRGRDSNFKDLSEDQVLEAIAYKLVFNSFKNFVGSSNPAVVEIPAIEIAERIYNDISTYSKEVQETGKLSTNSEASKNLQRTVVGHIPLIGKMTESWLMGGAEAFNEKQRKDRSKVDSVGYKN